MELPQLIHVDPSYSTSIEHLEKISTCLISFVVDNSVTIGVIVKVTLGLRCKPHNFCSKQMCYYILA